MNINMIRVIRKEFRRSGEARYIHRLHGVFLVLSGLSSVQVGKLLHDPGRTVAHWVKEFKLHGLEGLKDADRAGRPTILDTRQKRALKSALKKSPKDSGLDGDVWTGALVAAFVNNSYHVHLTMRHCRRIMRSLGSEHARGR